jgi:hypothetical protein
MNPQNKFTTLDLAEMSIMVALLEAGKWALQPIPNVEVVTLLFIVFTASFGIRTIFVSFAFTALETFWWGINTWNIMYLYIWPLLILYVYFTRNKGGLWFYSISSCIFGLFFGALCSIPYLFIGGPHMMFTWWVAGIPYDILHGISNFAVCLVLYKPLEYACTRIRKIRR